MVREISGMSMFCCRCSRPTSSSLIFFCTDGTSLSPSLRVMVGFNRRKELDDYITSQLPGMVVLVE